jgi:hypothetical protein
VKFRSFCSVPTSAWRKVLNGGRETMKEKKRMRKVIIEIKREKYMQQELGIWLFDQSVKL